MFAYVHGKLHRKAPGTAVVDVGGVGYRVQIPLSTFYELGEEGTTVHLRITCQIRDDAIVLYGFLTEPEQEMFRHLVSVSGVGPRTALAVLSGMPVAEAAAAIVAGEAARLQTIPGIGRRTAERLTLELRDRVGGLAAGAPPAIPPAGEAGVRQDVISALVNLGYPGGKAERATDAVLAGSAEEPEFSAALRETLRRMHR